MIDTLIVLKSACKITTVLWFRNNVIEAILIYSDI